MGAISIADAKAHFSELVDRAESGEEVSILRRGKAVARLVPARRERKPVDVAALRALTGAGLKQEESAASFIRRMREEDRY